MNFPKELYHAYVVEGNVSASRKALLDFLADTYNVLTGNPDLFLFSADALSIDDARAITDANMRKALSSAGASSGKKFIVADFHSVSGQAQNALLKTLEEPYPGTHIFLVTSTAATLLPTVLSRVHVIKHTEENSKKEPGETSQSTSRPTSQPEFKTEFDPQKEARKFLVSKPTERLEMIKQFLAEKEKENIGDADIETFISALEGVAHVAIKDSFKLKSLLVADEYIRDSSSSKKLLLEYVALTLPAGNI